MKHEIAFILPFLFRYQRGVERSGINLANELARQGHSITIFTWQERTASTNFHVEEGLRIYQVPYVRYYRACWAVPYYAIELLRHSYKSVNIYFAGYGEARSIAFARKFKKFQVNFIAGYPIEQVPHRFQEFRQYGLDKLLDNIVVKSPSMSAGISDFFQKDVCIIPNGVDIEYFNPESIDASELRQKLGLSSDDKVLLTVAALEGRKGIQDVIHALPRLLQTGLKVHYVVVGDGPDKTDIKKTAHRIGVSEWVHFVGSIKDVRPYYKLADVFCLLSYGEGLPNALLEAWAMELPVILSNHPPFPNVAENEFSSLVELSDEVNLSRILLYFLNNPELRSQLGRMARGHVKEIYQWDIVARRFGKLLMNI